MSTSNLKWFKIIYSQLRFNLFHNCALSDIDLFGELMKYCEIKITVEMKKNKGQDIKKNKL